MRTGDARRSQAPPAAGAALCGWLQRRCVRDGEPPAERGKAGPPLTTPPAWGPRGEPWRERKRLFLPIWAWVSVGGGIFSLVELNKLRGDAAFIM
eukprot:gene3467-1516_t